MAEETITGYKLAQEVNELLEKHGNKLIPAQMVYNYMKNRLIPSTDGRITRTAADAWKVKYLGRKGITVTEKA